MLGVRGYLPCLLMLLLLLPAHPQQETSHIHGRADPRDFQRAFDDVALLDPPLSSLDEVLDLGHGDGLFVAGLSHTLRPRSLAGIENNPRRQIAACQTIGAEPGPLCVSPSGQTTLRLGDLRGAETAHLLQNVSVVWTHSLVFTHRLMREFLSGAGAAAPPGLLLATQQPLPGCHIDWLHLAQGRMKTSYAPDLVDFEIYMRRLPLFDGKQADVMAKVERLLQAASAGCEVESIAVGSPGCGNAAALRRGRLQFILEGKNRFQDIADAVHELVPTWASHGTGKEDQAVCVLKELVAFVADQAVYEPGLSAPPMAHRVSVALESLALWLGNFSANGWEEAAAWMGVEGARRMASTWVEAYPHNLTKMSATDEDLEPVRELWRQIYAALAARTSDAHPELSSALKLDVDQLEVLGLRSQYASLASTSDGSQQNLLPIWLLIPIWRWLPSWLRAWAFSTDLKFQPDSLEHHLSMMMIKQEL